MTKQVLKSIVTGILIGAALFILPFLILRIALFFLLISTAMRLLGGRRFGRGNGYRFNRHFADEIRNTSEDEYLHFKQKFRKGGSQSSSQIISID